MDYDAKKLLNQVLFPKKVSVKHVHQKDLVNSEHITTMKMQI